WMLAAPLPSRSHWHSPQDQPSTPGQHRSQKLPFSPLPQTRVVCCLSSPSPVSSIPLLRIDLAANSCHHGRPSFAPKSIAIIREQNDRNIHLLRESCQADRHPQTLPIWLPIPLLAHSLFRPLDHRPKFLDVVRIELMD